MALQNLELDGKKSRFDWINPFDKIADSASRQAWLPRLDDTRMRQWLKEYLFRQKELYLTF